MGLHNAFNENAMMEEAASLGPGGQADQLCAAENRKAHKMTAERPTEHELLSGAGAGGGTPLAGSHRPAMARCTAMVAAKFVINRSHGDGSPAFGAEVSSTQEKPLVFTYLDPEKKGRSIGQQVDDYIAIIQRQAAEELEQSAS